MTSIRRVGLLLLGLLVFASFGLGQTAPTPQHFIISGSSASFGGNAVSVASGGVQLTSSMSAAFESISNPMDSSKPRVNSGVVNYTTSACTFIPAKLRSKLLIDCSNYNATFQGGAGVRSDASLTVGGPRTQSIVGNFGIFGSRPLPGGHTQIGLGYKAVVGKNVAVVKIPLGTLNFTF
jgi:hypothetical protein